MSKKAYEIDCFWKVFVAFCRIWAISTAFGLWGVGVEALYYHHMLGIYLIVTAAIMSFLESVFLLNYFIIACTDETSSLCLQAWDVVLWLDNYKKGLLYLALAAACFVQPHTLWMALISGGMLIVSGILYSLKTIRSRSEQRQRAASQKPSYDKFDEVPEEEIEDSIISAVESGATMSTVGDQPEILNV